MQLCCNVARTCKSLISAIFYVVLCTTIKESTLYHTLEDGKEFLSGNLLTLRNHWIRREIKEQIRMLDVVDNSSEAALYYDPATFDDVTDIVDMDRLCPDREPLTFTY